MLVEGGSRKVLDCQFLESVRRERRSHPALIAFDRGPPVGGLVDHGRAEVRHLAKPSAPPRRKCCVALGAGNCEFSNAVIAERRIAVDLNPDTRAHAAPSVEVILTSSEDLGPVADQSVDTVFSSNFFEHLRSKDALLRTLDESHRVLRPGGKIVVLMPNIRYLAGRYWDYFDHHLPLTHSSLGEALELSGFRVERVVPKFLPYTVKDAPVRIPPAVIALYLRFPPACRLLGRQVLVVASRP